MKYRLFLQRLMIPLTCLVAVLVHAEEGQGRLYWVLGSFTDQAVAMGEGEKISQATGLEIVYSVSDVNNSTYYRLLVPQFDDAEDQTRLKLQLGYAGIDKPWSLRLDDTLTRYLSSPVASQQRLYLVLGSFEKYEDAQRQVDSIMDTFNQVVELREFTINGKSVIRVMAGPYEDKAGIEVARELFDNSQFDDAWVIKLQSEYQDMMSSYESYEDVDYLDVPESKPDRDLIFKEATRRSTQLPENTIDPGFNLARLRKGPED